MSYKHVDVDPQQQYLSQYAARYAPGHHRSARKGTRHLLYSFPGCHTAYILVGQTLNVTLSSDYSEVSAQCPLGNRENI